MPLPFTTDQIHHPPSATCRPPTCQVEKATKAAEAKLAQRDKVRAHSSQHNRQPATNTRIYFQHSSPLTTTHFQARRAKYSPPELHGLQNHFLGALTALSDAHAASKHWENAYRYGKRALRVVQRAAVRDERRVIMLAMSLGHICDRRDDSALRKAPNNVTKTSYYDTIPAVLAAGHWVMAAQAFEVLKQPLRAAQIYRDAAQVLTGPKGAGNEASVFDGATKASLIEEALGYYTNAAKLFASCRATLMQKGAPLECDSAEQLSNKVSQEDSADEHLSSYRASHHQPPHPGRAPVVAAN